MPYSSKRYVADGVETEFNVPFPYLDRSHVLVTVNKVLTTDEGSEFEFVFLSADTIRIRTIVGSLPVPDGDEIVISRRTPINTPAVVFGSGSSITSGNLNKSSEYLTFALQEASDDNQAFTKLYLGSFEAAPTTDNEGEPLQVGAVYYDVTETALFYWTGSTWIIGESTSAAAAARDDAEAARDAAVIAKNQAETAQGEAEGFAGAASTSAGEAENAVLAAEDAVLAAEDAAEVASDARDAVINSMTPPSRVTTGTGAAMVLDVGEAFRKTALVEGDQYVLRAHTDNTGVLTLAVVLTEETTPAAPLQRYVGDTLTSLEAGEIVEGNHYRVQYDGTGWVLLSQAPNLSQAQVEDSTSTVFGVVNGQRLSQAVAEFAPPPSVAPMELQLLDSVEAASGTTHTLTFSDNKIRNVFLVATSTAFGGTGFGTIDLVTLDGRSVVSKFGTSSRTGIRAGTCVAVPNGSNQVVLTISGGNLLANRINIYAFDMGVFYRTATIAPFSGEVVLHTASNQRVMSNTGILTIPQHSLIFVRVVSAENADYSVSSPSGAIIAHSTTRTLVGYRNYKADDAAVVDITTDAGTDTAGNSSLASALFEPSVKVS